MLNSLRANKPINKRADLNRHFSKEDIQLAKRHVRNITNIREMQLKTTMRSHPTPVRMAIVKNPQTINAGETMESRECSCTTGGNVHW